MRIQNAKKQSPFFQARISSFPQTVRLTSGQLDQIEQLQEEYDVSFSTVVRVLIDKGLNSLP